MQVKYTKLPDNITFTAGFLTGDDGKKSLVLSMKYKDRAEEKTDPNDKPIVGSVNLGTGKFAKNTTFKFELTGDPGAPMPEGAVGNVYTYTLEAGDAEKQKSISFAAPVFTTPTPLDQYYIYTLSMKDDLDSLYEADTTRYLIRYTVTRNNGKIDYSYNVLKKDGDGKKQSDGCVFNVKPKVTRLTVSVSYKDDFTGIDNKGTKATVQAQRKTQSGGWEAVPGDGYNKDISRTTTSSGDGKADSTGDKYVFDNLQVCDDEGNLYQYRAIETAVTLEDDSRKTATGNEATDAAPAGKAGGYSYTSKHDGEWKNGFTSAIHNVIPTGIIKAVKAWEDKDSSGRPASITLRLQRKGEGEDSSFQDVETKTLNVKAGETTATWEGVPAVNTAGDSYTCRIAEDPVKGYSSKSAPAEAKVRENETTTVTVKNTAEEPETPGPETDKPAQPETPSPETAAPQDETDAPVPQTEAPKKKETEKKETEKKTPPAETPEQIAEKAAEIAGRITGIKGAYRVPADKLTEEENKILTAAGYRLMDTDGDGTLDTYVLGAARTGDETPVLPYTYALLAAAALIAAVMRSRKSIFRS